jgi:hypothetical protein
VISALLLAATLAAAPAPRLGAHVTITEPTLGPVVSVLGSLQVEAEVSGDVIALGGDITLGHGVRVSGDAVAVGGAVQGAGSVAGRAVSIGSLDAAAFPPVGGAASARVAWGMRALRVGGWLIVAALLLLAFPRQVRRGGEHLRLMPVRTFLAGGLALVVWLIVVLLALALAVSRLGVALLLVGVLAFLVAKVLGLLAVAWLLGWGLRQALPVAWRGEIARTGAGMFVLAGIGLLPLLGPLVWLAANVAGVGAMVAVLVVPRLAAAALPLRGSAST